MSFIQSICGFIKESKSDSEYEMSDELEVNLSENTENKSHGIEEKPKPRDGMSAESAKFLIGKCTNNTAFKVYGLENKGRYFTAKVIDPKGKVVNEILVDKLNGRVKFIR